MEEYFAADGDRQMEAGEREHQAPTPLIDFFARENEINRVDESDTALIEPLNDVTDLSVHQRQEHSPTSGIEFVPLYNNQTDQLADPSDLVYYDFFNGGNPVNAAAADMVEQSVPNIENLAPDNQLNAAADVGGQTVQDIDSHAPTNQQSATAIADEQVAVLHIEYIDYNDIASQLNAAADAVEHILATYNLFEQSVDEFGYYAPDNQLTAAGVVGDNFAQETQSSSGDDVVEISFLGRDYNALAEQLRAAADVYEQSQSVVEDNYMAQENHPIVPQASLNGEMGSNDTHRLVIRLRYRGDVEDYSDYDEEEPPIHEHPASRSAVRNLASVTFTPESVARDAGTCAVCHDEFDVGDTAKMLPCSHYYHEGCILAWLDRQHTCPLCRYELPTDDA